MPRNALLESAPDVHPVRYARDQIDAPTEVASVVWTEYSIP